MKKLLIGVMLCVATLCAKAAELEGEVCWLDSTYHVVMQEQGQPLKLDVYVESLYDAVQAARDAAGVAKLYKVATGKGRENVMQLYTFEKPRVYVGKIVITTEVRCKCKTNCDG